MPVLGFTEYFVRKNLYLYNPRTNIIMLYGSVPSGKILSRQLLLPNRYSIIMQHCNLNRIFNVNIIYIHASEYSIYIGGLHTEFPNIIEYIIYDIYL